MEKILGGDHFIITTYNEMPTGIIDHICNVYVDNRLNRLELIGYGTFGRVYKLGRYAIKAMGAIETDEEILNDLSHLDFIPNVYAKIEITNRQRKIVIMDYIDGYTLEKYINKPLSTSSDSLDISYTFINRCYDAIKYIVSSGYSPFDLHGGNVIVARKDNVLTPIIIDVGNFQKIDESDLLDYRDDGGYRTAEGMFINMAKKRVNMARRKLLNV